MAVSIEKLEKIYKVKGGADVRALKGISFNLPDTGMVFVLGKSGCGKSTLLNILGGLDGFDGGDVIIDGRSAKGRGAKESDRYRNEYVGFVFQENNLLEKESVKSNVGLALDLQRLKETADKVDAALESVGLKDYADRKCNRLSGGQKQRVAIARAIIKSPKLLLCDEPTGALDSETGEEIFALLKKISRDRLVVVVSHDREAAEVYGDRVIELKDGEIISDSAPQGMAAETDTFTRDGVNGGKKKRAGLRFVRVLRIGSGYIIARPVRMIICLIICLIAFSSVGAADSVYAFDRDRALMYTMENRGALIYEFGKGYYGSENDEIIFNAANISREQADELSSLIKAGRSDCIIEMRDVVPNNMLNVGWDGTEHHVLLTYSAVTGYLETSGSFCRDYGFEILSGRLPENTGEVALPLYLFEFFKAYGYRIYTDDLQASAVSVNDYGDLIGKSLKLNIRKLPELTVTGIIDTRFNYLKQRDKLFNAVSASDGSYTFEDLSSDMYLVGQDCIHSTVFVCDGFDKYYSEIAGHSREDNVLRVIAPFTGSAADKLKNIGIYKTQFNNLPVGGNRNVCYTVTNCSSKLINDAGRLAKTINEYAVYGLLVLITIAALFVTYYASGTIDEKSREIGILRALGASRADVIKITVCEHGIFTAAAFAISSVLGLACTAALNASFSQVEGLAVKVLQFGIRQTALIAAVAVGAIVLGVAIPLIRLLKAKPADVMAGR